MTPDLVVLQALNGLAFGALLFILAAGLSLVFGMMDIVNLAHGAFYMLGAYIAFSLVQGSSTACLRVGTLDFWAALAIVPVVLAAAGFVLEPLLLRRLRGRHLEQVLLTIGLSIVVADLVRWCWGGENRSIAAPAGLDGSVAVLGDEYPVYRIALIFFGIALAAGLWIVHERTRLGALVRAGVADTEMLSALGVDTDRLFAFVFAAGAALAGLAGVVASPFLLLQPGMDETGLIFSLVVVVVGGLGTLGGAFFGSLIIGVVKTFGDVLLPQLSLALIFMLMAAVLLARPSGLFGRRR